MNEDLTPHLCQTTLFGDACAECGLEPNATCHIDADGRVGLRHDAGETMRAGFEFRSRGTFRAAVYRCIVEKGPVCTKEIEASTGIIHETASPHVNGLMRDGLVTLIPDPNGKRHRLIRGKGRAGVVVGEGPWRVTRWGKAPVLLWVASDHPEGF